METKQRPILFSTPMVQAIIAGKKTMTRRVLKPAVDTKYWKASAFDRSKEWRKTPLLGPGHYGHSDTEWALYNIDDPYGAVPYTGRICPYGKPGDLLWVRETTCIPPKFWASPCNHNCIPDPDGDMRHVSYKADGHPEDVMRDYKLKWTPSIHVPKWTARIWLKVTDIRVEHLQEISEEDALAEGIDLSPIGITNKTCFKILWDSINKKRGYGWGCNPWVWVVEFERTEKPEEV